MSTYTLDLLYACGTQLKRRCERDAIPLDHNPYTESMVLYSNIQILQLETYGSKAEKTKKIILVSQLMHLSGTPF